MGVALEKGTQTNVVRLEGAIGIGCAAELKQALLEALEPAKHVEVTLIEVRTLDVTAVQMIWAAKLAANAPGKRFTVDEQLPGPLSTALSDAGLAEILFKP